MANPEQTDSQWKEQLLQSYLTPYEQNYVSFSIEYAKGYRLVMPKKTFIPQCCFFCLQKSHEDEGEPEIFNQGIRTEIFPHDHPMSCLYYCSNEKCKIGARISEQIHIADRKIARFNPTSPILTTNITVKRTNGDLEFDWTVRHYQFHPPDVGQPPHLSIYVVKADGTLKGFSMSDFLTTNADLIRKQGLNSITPYFDEWYPPTRSAEIMKLFNDYISKAGLNLRSST